MNQPKVTLPPYVSPCLTSSCKSSNSSEQGLRPAHCRTPAAWHGAWRSWVSNQCPGPRGHKLACVPARMRAHPCGWHLRLPAAGEGGRQGGLISGGVSGRPCHCEVWSWPPSGTALPCPPAHSTALREAHGRGPPGFLEKAGHRARGCRGWARRWPWLPTPVPGLRRSGRMAWGPAALRPLEQPAGEPGLAQRGGEPLGGQPPVPETCQAGLGRVSLWGTGLRLLGSGGGGAETEDPENEKPRPTCLQTSHFTW